MGQKHGGPARGPSVLAFSPMRLVVAFICAAGGSALAQDNEARIEELERQIEALQRQLQDLRDAVVEQERGQRQPVAPPDVGAPLVSTAEGVRLSVSGQVNRGILFSDDGESTDVFFVDNDSSSTRVRFEGEAALTEDVAVGSVIEVQIESNSTADVNQADQDAGSVGFTDRKLELFAAHDRFGKLWLGQGSTASDGTSEVDLSGTAVIGYSSIGDLAGGLLFRREDGTLSDTSIGDTYSNLDGLGRLDRIRYDTPVLLGFQGAIGAVSDDRWDAALRYSSRLAGTTVAAAIAYADGSGFDQVNGSGSILLGHDAGVFEGVSVTIASGARDFDRAGRDDGTFYYGKLGYEFQPFAFGSTAGQTQIPQGHSCCRLGFAVPAVGAQGGSPDLLRPVRPAGDGRARDRGDPGGTRARDRGDPGGTRAGARRRRSPAGARLLRAHRGRGPGAARVPADHPTGSGDQGLVPHHAGEQSRRMARPTSRRGGAREDLFN